MNASGLLGRQLGCLLGCLALSICFCPIFFVFAQTRCFFIGFLPRARFGFALLALFLFLFLTATVALFNLLLFDPLTLCLLFNFASLSGPYRF